ncbi:MAG TPA: 4-alpha-glucanotransferase, partial [Mycobacteriales bacterium]|nr:4-alpha-glucanotransferase [Mycobacteriales bacterium]
EDAERVIEPVQVMAPDGTLSGRLLLSPATDAGRVTVTVTSEAGEISETPLIEVAWPDENARDDRRIAYRMELGALRLGTGYHRLGLKGPKLEAGSLVLVPPGRLPAPHFEFGVVTPLYAIRGDDDWGIGSFTDLARFASWVQHEGGSYAGTLPLFAGSFHEPVDPSPYLPYSRLFWNEIFLDVTTLPEARAAGVSALLGGCDLRRELEELAGRPAVDYAAVMRRKRAVLMACTAELIAGGGARRAAYDAYLAANPELSRYAEFRAVDDHAATRWRSWAPPAGRLPEELPEPASIEYHRYVQFAAATQLAAAATGGAGLYLDLPVGVHADGYDVWAYSDVFAEAGVGAPPDAFFAGGQSWGFPPLHPDRLRESGYEYFIRALREALRYAAGIRIDHVLGLHRMFWIPAGGDARTGAYVRYPDRELRAVIAIEADRAAAVVVGEDLGTVTPAIRQAMDRDGMLHSFVTRFEASVDDPLPQPRRPAAASLGTHDLPKFATYWSGADIDERLAAGEVDPAEAAAEADARSALVAATVKAAGIEDDLGRGSDQTVHEALAASLSSLAAGPAPLVLVDLGDLLGERAPDNRPGTGPEAGNWRHRLPKRFDAIAGDPAVTGVLAGVRDRRSAAAEGASR